MQRLQAGKKILRRCVVVVVLLGSCALMTAEGDVLGGEVDAGETAAATADNTTNVEPTAAADGSAGTDRLHQVSAEAHNAVLISLSEID